MSIPTATYRRLWIGLLAASGTLGCNGDRAASPGDGRSSVLAGLPNRRLLFDDSRPLAAAVPMPDSASSEVLLARVTLRGKAGSVVALKLELASEALTAAGPDAAVTMEGAGRKVTFSLRELARGTVAYRFARDESVDLVYRLPRIVQGIAPGEARLELHTDAAIEALLTPWIRRASGAGQSAAAQTGTSCSLAAASGSCGTMNFTISPFVIANGSIGGTFQSNAGTGPSSPITIAFSQPISQVMTTIQDPTWAGNQMIAYDANGAVVGSVSFVFNGTPGTNDDDTQSLTGAISRIDLVPAPDDYVAYDVTVSVDTQAVVVTCTPAPVRGGPVTCTTSMVIPEPFTVLRRTAYGSRFRVRSTPNTSYAAGGSDAWAGTAVASAVVDVAVRTVSGVQYTDDAPFDVQSRDWPAWNLTTLASYVVAKHYLFGDVPIGGIAGIFRPRWPNLLDSTSIDQPSQGPNEGLAYFRDQVAVTMFDIAIHPGLIAPPGGLKPGQQGYMVWHQWFDDQDGKGAGTCTKHDVTQIRSNVDRHEGRTMAVPNSHFAVANAQFALRRPERLLEPLYTNLGNAALLRRMLFAISAFDGIGSYRVAQDSFDLVDTPIVSSFGINCVWDMDLIVP